jgi:hypothetical protein
VWLLASISVFITFHQKGIEDSYSAQQSGWWLTHSPIVHRRGERLFDWLDFLSFISVQTIKKKIASEILSFSWLNSRNSSFAAKMIKPSIRGCPSEFGKTSSVLRWLGASAPSRFLGFLPSRMNRATLLCRLAVELVFLYRNREQESLGRWTQSSSSLRLFDAGDCGVIQQATRFHTGPTQRGLIESPPAMLQSQRLIVSFLLKDIFKALRD